jgi:hypothetical protein
LWDFIFAQKCGASWDKCTGALSWWICQSADDHFSGCFPCTVSCRCRRTCKLLLLFQSPATSWCQGPWSIYSSFRGNL